MTRLAEYLLQNEETHKKANEHVVGNDIVPKDYLMTLHCECGDDECRNTIEATVQEWDSLHQEDLVFMVAPNHYFPRFEEIIGKTDKFWIVKKKEERLEQDT